MSARRRRRVNHLVDIKTQATKIISIFRSHMHSKKKILLIRTRGYTHHKLLGQERLSLTVCLPKVRSASSAHILNDNPSREKSDAYLPVEQPGQNEGNCG